MTGGLRGKKNEGRCEREEDGDGYIHVFVIHDWQLRLVNIKSIRSANRSSSNILSRLLTIRDLLTHLPPSPHSRLYDSRLARRAESKSQSRVW